MGMKEYENKITQKVHMKKKICPWKFL